MPLVPLQSNSGPNTSLFAPAGSGGGGGAGPNPVVSTITLPTANGVNAGTVLYTEELVFGNGGFQPTHQIRHSASAFPTDASVIDIISPDGTTTASLAACNGLGLNFQVFSNTSAQLPIDFGNTALTNISSINGAAPGGGPPPAVVSTISSLVNVSTINSGSPGILTVAGSVVVTDYLGASQISTPSIVSIVPGGAVSVQNLTTSSITSAAAIINMTAPVGVSSLAVSSINGAAYIPGLKMETGVTALDAGGSTIIETDKIYLVTDPVPQVTYKGAVGPGVSSLGAEALSPSTFIVYGAPNANINWFTAGS